MSDAHMQTPCTTYASNVLGTVHLLESVRRTPCVKAVIIVTSDKCYDDRNSIWGYREIDPLGGHDPYSSSKGCTELVVDSYRRSFFDVAYSPSIASARAGNVIGGGDWQKTDCPRRYARLFAGRAASNSRSGPRYGPGSMFSIPLLPTCSLLNGYMPKGKVQQKDGTLDRRCRVMFQWLLLRMLSSGLGDRCTVDGRWRGAPP